MRKITILVFIILSAAVTLYASLQKEVAPLFVTDVKMYNGNVLMTNRTGGALVLVDPKSGDIINKTSFDMPATGVAIHGDKAYVTTSYDKGQLVVVDLKSFEKEKVIAVGMGARSPIIDNEGKYIYICNQYKGTIEKIDISSGAVVAVGQALREPFAAVLSKDGKNLFVNNFLPAQAANLDLVAADVSVFDTQTMQKVKDIKLDNGSNALRDITLSPDGRYVFVTHNLGRFQVPTSQLQQGWMNTSAVSVIDALGNEFVASVLLDEPERGAAGIWGVECSNDFLIISHSGTHDISVIPYNDFVNKFDNYPAKANLSYDLYFMYGMRQRIPIVGNGPRYIALEGNNVYVPTFFSDTLTVINLLDKSVEAVGYNTSRVESRQNMGEKYFNDAKYCFQNWQSCNGCHPGDARTDGMNWDLMNDGIGNSKNCKSMLYSHVTSPSMISGIRESAELAVRMGYKLIQFTDIAESELTCVDDYLKGLTPLPSPYLKDGKLSELAVKGREVFEKLKCNDCHSGTLFTDRSMHRIGEDIEFEKGWDTPTLIEVWRTAPYLFDGRAATMREVFEKYKHGVHEKMNPKDIDALTEYILSL